MSVESEIATSSLISSTNSKVVLEVIEILSDYPKMPIAKLVTFVYKEIDQSLHDLAQRSLLAHLLKLKKEGSVICENENWELILK